MLITFKSDAGGDVIMFGDVAKQLLSVMGKSVDKQGIITLEQLPGALTQLRQAVAESKTVAARKDEPKQDKKDEQRPFVSLAQRAVPLVQLLEYSLKAEVPVTWQTS